MKSPSILEKSKFNVELRKNAKSTVAGKGHLDMSIFYLYPEFSSGLINTRSRVLTQDREF